MRKPSAIQIHCVTEYELHIEFFQQSTFYDNSIQIQLEFF